MRRLHIVPEINEASGVYQVARDLAREQGGELIDCSDCSIVRLRDGNYDEVWVHGMWLPRIWSTCWKVLSLQTSNVKRQTSNVKRQASNLKRQTSNVKPSLIRMTHGSLSPIYLERQGKWRKKLVAPIERWLLRRTEKVVATCEAEKRWIEEYEPRVKRVEVADLKRFFNIVRLTDCSIEKKRNLHVLYLGRRHPLKGVEFLEKAVDEVNTTIEQSEQSNNRTICLRVVSDHFGEELEKDWEWCDVLCLPTLSENFGRVVAEALERGKRAITTDGAPAWEPEESEKEKGKVKKCGRLFYLRGYRDGTDEERVRLLKEALVSALT